MLPPDPSTECLAFQYAMLELTISGMVRVWVRVIYVIGCIIRVMVWVPVRYMVGARVSKALWFRISSALWL